jgi:hypothetical protein
MSTNKPSHRVLIARDDKDAQLIRVGALWPGKNDSLSGDIDLIFGKFRLVIVPVRDDEDKLPM